MKNIRYYLIAAALLMALTGKAQDSPLTFGIKGGVNLSNFSDNVGDPKPKAGYQAGITLDCKITTDVYILTGLEVTNKGAKEKYMESDGEKITLKHKPLYLQLPVHAGYKMAVGESSRIVLHAGPYLAYGISGKLNEIDYFGDNGFAKRFDYGFGLGVGLEVGKFAFNVGFDSGLANIVNDVIIVDSNGNVMSASDDSRKMKNQSSYFTLGYKF